MPDLIEPKYPHGVARPWQGRGYSPEKDIDGNVMSPGLYYVNNAPDSRDPNPYIVICYGDGTQLGDTYVLGRFWQRKYADLFLAALRSQK